MVAVPIDQPLPRRDVMRYAGAAFAAVAAAGCTGGNEPEPPKIDVLAEFAAAARRDAQLAGALAIGLPDRQAALGIVAAERTAHAEALETEIARVTPPTSTTGTPSTTAPVVDVPPFEAFVAQLTTSARRAADTARTLSGFRAGLLGSISAACAVHVGVVLR